MIPLLESEIPSEVYAFAEMYNLQNFPTEYLVEQSDMGYIIINVQEHKYCVVASPNDWSVFPDIKQYLNTEAIEENTAKPDEVAYGFAWTCKRELAQCTNYWTTGEIRHRVRMILDNPTDYSMTTFLQVLGEVIRRTNRYDLADILHYMKSENLYPFSSNTSVSTGKTKWLN